MLRMDEVCVMAKENKVILNKFSFMLKQGTAIGLTGESGAGKSTIIRAIMGFLGKGCFIGKGSIFIDDVRLNDMSSKKRRELCGITVGFIPQNPMTAFDSRLKLGVQMEETFCCRLGISKKQARDLSIEKLELVNLSDYERILDSFPSQLSGGMLQRVAFAILLGLKPKYILADEPTSALDEKNRDLLLNLLRKQKEEAGILLISHNLVALDGLCETVLVLNEGQIIEEGTIEKLMKEPKHIWTKQFVKSNYMQNTGGWKWRVS